MKRILRFIKNKIKNIFSKKQSALKFVDDTVHFTGKKYIFIGKNSMLSQNTWLNVNKRGQTRIFIGDNCFIGRNNFFTSGELIKLGDYVVTSVNCCFIGEKHSYDNPFLPYMYGETSGTDSIIIGTNCFIGANVTIQGNCNIGFGSIVGVNSHLMNCVIPPLSIVVGTLEHRIIKRYSLNENKWKNLKDWNELDEKSIPSETDYSKMLRKGIIEKFNSQDIPLPVLAIGKSNGDLYE